MYICIKGVENLELINNHIYSLRIEEYSGLRLPIAKVQFQATREYIQYIRLWLEITIEFSNEDEVIKTYTFDLLDYKNQPSSDGKTVLVEFSLMHKYRELVKTYKQELIEDTSTDILKKYGFDVESNCEDEPQIYIRPNISEKAFYRQLIQHTYLGLEDCPISTISLNGKKMKSFKDTYEKEEPYIKLAREAVDGTELFRIIQQEASSTLSDQLFGIDNVNSILKADISEVYYLDYQGSVIEDLSKYSREHNLVLNQTINDNCNCHPNYYKAQIRNRTGWLALNSERIIIELSSRELRLDIPLLSIAEILEKEDEDNYKEYAGKWLITSKYIGVDENIATTYLQLSRVPKEYFKRFRDV